MKELFYKDNIDRLLELLTDLYGFMDDTIIDVINHYSISCAITSNMQIINALSVINRLPVSDPDDIILCIGRLANSGYGGKETGKAIFQYVYKIRSCDNNVTRLIKKYCDNPESLIQVSMLSNDKVSISDLIYFFGPLVGAAIMHLQYIAEVD